MKSTLAFLTVMSLLFLDSFAQPTVSLAPFSTGYNNPVDIAHVGDSRLFIVEQGGTIWITDSLGVKQSTPFMTKSVTSGGERGLLGLAFDPNYDTNGYFYIYYSQGSNSKISRYSVSSSNPDVADPSSETVIMTISQPFSNHNGGDIEFGQDGYLYIGLGDGGSGGDPGNRSQNRQLLLGKMLRIDVSILPYTIPASNPFVGDTTTLDEIWAIGLRNPWRWSFDRQTGDMWIGDVGQSAREEIHMTPAGSPGGQNYGWRCYEGNLTFDTSGCGPITDYDFPVYDYPRVLGQSVTGGFVYRGQKSTMLDGIYFFGDYGTGRLWGTWPDTAGAWTTYEFLNTSYQWSTFGEDQHGEVYGANYNNGNIYRIEGPCASFSVDLTATDVSCTGAQNGAIQLTTTGGGTLDSILWSNGATSQNLSNLNAGSYTVTVIDDTGCERTVTANIQAGSAVPVPAITTQGATQLCPGNSVTLTADLAPAGFSYQWLLNGAVLPGFTNQTLSASSGGDYQITYTGPCPSDTSAAIQVENIAAPMAPTIGGTNSGTYCEDEMVILTSSTAPNGFFYHWYQDSNLLSISSASLPITTSGDYYVQFDGPCTSPSSAVISIQIEAIPDAPVFTSIDTVRFCELEMSVLQGPTAPAGYTYQWYESGIPVSDGTQQSLEVYEAGVYSLSFHGICESELADPIPVQVLPLPEPLISQVGDTLTATQGASWVWYLDSMSIPDANSQSYVATASGTYSVSVTDAMGCTGESEDLSLVLTGLEEWIVASSIKISPNPAYEQVEVSCELKKETALEIKLSDVQGRILQSQSLSRRAGEIQVNFATANLPAGMYLIHIQGEELRYTSRLIVAK